MSSSVVHEATASVYPTSWVHVPVEDVLQPVLDDDHRGAGLFLQLVDELHGLFPRGGVQIGQGLVEKQDIDIDGAVCITRQGAGGEMRDARCKMQDARAALRP